MKPNTLRLITPLAIGLVALGILLPMFEAPATAQNAAQSTITATPDPTATAAATLFTIEQATMNSLYPAGLEFVFAGASSAGDIERVTVNLWSQDGTTQRLTLDWDDERGAWVYFDRRYEPPWFQVFYRFRVLDSAGNVYETADMHAEYVDNTRDWVRRENDEVILLTYGVTDEFIDQLFESVTKAVNRLEEAHGFALDYKPYAVVFPDEGSFQEWQEYVQTDLAGLTLSDRGYTVQRVGRDVNDLVYAFLPHELTHIFQGFADEALDIPIWFTEGHATYFETVYSYDYEDRVRNIVIDPRFPTLQDNFDAAQAGPDGRGRLGYDVGYTFIKYWIDTYGLESHRAFWQAQATMNFEDAMQAATGKTMVELETEWRAWLGATGPAPTLIPEPTMLPFPTAPAMPTLPGSD